MSSAGAGADAAKDSKGLCGDGSWVFILRVTGGLCGAVIVAVGIYQLATLKFDGGNGVKVFMNAFYQMIFGLLIIVSEFRWTFALKYFRFLSAAIGIGLFYIFVGGLALGSEWWEYMIAIIFWSVGLLYLILACAGKSKDLGLPKVEEVKKQIGDNKEMSKRPSTAADVPVSPYSQPNKDQSDGWSNTSSAYSNTGKGYVPPSSTASPFGAGNSNFGNTSSGGSAYDMSSKNSVDPAASSKANPFDEPNPFV